MSIFSTNVSLRQLHLSCQNAKTNNTKNIITHFRHIHIHVDDHSLHIKMRWRWKLWDRICSIPWHLQDKKQFCFDIRRWTTQGDKQCDQSFSFNMLTIFHSTLFRLVHEWSVRCSERYKVYILCMRAYVFMYIRQCRSTTSRVFSRSSDCPSHMVTSKPQHVNPLSNSLGTNQPRNCTPQNNRGGSSLFPSSLWCGG